MTGAIVLAAYEPSLELLVRQLRSIRAQTVEDWVCVIAVDGGDDAVRQGLAEAVGDDSRFRLVSDGRRLGFYLNFERGLEAVPDDAEWIALSDQDDYWYPQKLEVLLPHLADVALVSGQARLVRYPEDREIGTTGRLDLDADLTMLVNQYTGSLCIFRADLLSIALPFPRLSSRTVAHDHWLAMVAFANGGARVVDELVQDYVQHDANVFGDPSGLRTGPLRTMKRAITNVIAFSRRYEGSASPRAMARMLFWVYVGWRQLMAETLVARCATEPESDAGVVRALSEAFGRRRRLSEARRLLRAARRAGAIPRAFGIAYAASWIAGAFVSGRSLEPTSPTSS